MPSSTHTPPYGRSFFCAFGALAASLVAGCPSNSAGNGPSAAPSASASASASAAPSASATAEPTASAAPSASASASASATPSASAGPPAVLTLRVINAAAVPLRILTNEDTNELMHTRLLWDRRPADARGEGQLVKFFRVGQMPLCSEPAGAGYGGLGQPEPRTLAPGEAMEFAWDGQQRRETLQPERGVCQLVGAPDPGRYRFEFDQPYNAPQCNRPTITLPLAPDAPRVIEIRCQPRRTTPEPG